MNSHQHVNPYISGSPVTGTEMFYGRRDVFSFIRQNLIGRHQDHPIVLHGQRRAGKTSVLYQLHRYLDSRYWCILIDLHGLDLHGTGNLLFGIASAISKGLGRDHQVVVNTPDRAIFMSDPRAAFESGFLDQVWPVLGENHLVLMMDEVIRLDEEVKAGRLEREIFEYLRYLMQHYAHLNFVFSLGSGLEEMTKDYAFLFSVSLCQPISFLEPSAARELITEPVRDQYKMESPATERVLAITSGHPYYTQLVCHCVFALWSRFPRRFMTAQDVDAVLAGAVELGSANLAHVWEDSTPAEQILLAGVADAMRGEVSPVTIDKVRDAWRKAGVVLPQGEVTRALRSLLIRREVLVGSDVYSFAVDLQRLWLEKYRRLDWVRDDLAEHIQKWNRAANFSSYSTSSPESDDPGIVEAKKGTRSHVSEITGSSLSPRRSRRQVIIAVLAALVSLIIALTVLGVVEFNQRNQADRLASLAQSQEEQARLALQQYESSKAPSESSKAAPALSLQSFNSTINNVDTPGLIDGSPAAVAYVREQILQILSAHQLMGRQAGLVLVFGGDDSSDPSKALALDAAFDKVLMDLGNDRVVFGEAVYREFVQFGGPTTTVELQIYFFKN